MSTSVPPELMAHHCGRCGMWHHGSLCPDMRQQPPVTVIQGVDPQEHVSVTMERNVLRDQLAQAEADRDRFRTALAEIAALPRPQLQSERTWREVALEALRDG